MVGYGGAMWLAEQMANALFSDMEVKKNKEMVYSTSGEPTSSLFLRWRDHAAAPFAPNLSPEDE